MKVMLQVSKKDWKKARREVRLSNLKNLKLHRSECCVIAQCLKRNGYEQPHVGVFSGNGMKNGKKFVFELSQRAADMVRLFDSGYKSARKYGTIVLTELL